MILPISFGVYYEFYFKVKVCLCMINIVKRGSFPQLEEASHIYLPVFMTVFSSDCKHIKLKISGTDPPLIFKVLSLCAAAVS